MQNSSNVHKITLGLKTVLTLVWCFVLIFVLSGSQCIVSGINSMTLFHNVMFEEPLTLFCSGVSWRNSDGIINVDKFFVDAKLSDIFVLFKNFSLRIKSVSLDREDIYKCDINSTEALIHVVFVTGLYCQFVVLL